MRSAGARPPSWSRLLSRPAVPEIVVRDGRRAALVLGSAWYGHPARRLSLIGVTGTNGKTTTTGLLRHLLNGGGTAGSIGTVGAFDGRGEAVPSTAGSLTTPGPIDLQRTLAELVGARGHPGHHGDLVAQPGPGQARRTVVRRRAVHQSDPGPPRLPRHDGRLPGGEAQAEHAAGSEWGRGGEPGR